jgi:hypothetical protein
LAHRAHLGAEGWGGLTILFSGNNQDPSRRPTEWFNRKVPQVVNNTYEGDLIRPLGLVTLNFGYAEYEIDSLLQRLSDTGRLPGSWSQKPIGQKLSDLTKALKTEQPEVQAGLETLLTEVNSLLEQRNVLIHGCLLAGGRITSGRSGVEERRTSVDELNALAEAIFAWKERLSSFRWKRVEPLLAPGPG